MKNAKLYETDGISSNLQILQDGIVQQIESSRTSLHIDEDEFGLKIYLPRNKDKQQYTFTNSLSKKLFTWMMTDPVTQQSEIIDGDGINATRDILLSPYSELSAALEENGITSIAVDNSDALMPEPIPESLSTLVGTVADGIQDLGLNGDDDDDDDGSEKSSTSTSGSEILRSASHYTSASRWFNSARSLGSIRYSDTDERYIATLNNVIAAGRRDSLPARGEMNLRRYPNSELNSADLGLNSSSQFERDCKVGAAGELYVRFPIMPVQPVHRSLIL